MFFKRNLNYDWAFKNYNIINHLQSISALKKKINFISIWIELSFDSLCYFLGELKRKKIGEAFSIEKNCDVFVHEIYT